jgi:hypothetical protein
MRPATYAFAAALLAATWQFSAANAQTPPAQSPQTNTPQPQSPAPAYPATSIPDQKLDAAAAAMQRVASLKRDYLQQLEAASPDDQPRIASLPSRLAMRLKRPSPMRACRSRNTPPF